MFCEVSHRTCFLKIGMSPCEYLRFLICRKGYVRFFHRSVKFYCGIIIQRIFSFNLNR